MASPDTAQQLHAANASREDRLARVFHYHEETKHRFDRYARALGYMDWANQPDPFRRYQGAAVISLPLLSAEADPRSPAYDRLYGRGLIPPQSLTRASLSRFFEYALSLTAWKEYGGNRWALRSNPSSGNLHPTEGYLVMGAVPGLSEAPGVYHYAAKEHALERRMVGDPVRYRDMMQAYPPGAFLVGLTSIHWREAWKYGERAFRYCQHDVGHAIGTMRISAATLGWNLALLDGTDDDTMAHLVGIDRVGDYVDAEREHPDCVALIWSTETDERRAPTQGAHLPLAFESQAARRFVDASWSGQANRLSRESPIPWEIIDEVAAASWRSESVQGMMVVSPLPHPVPRTPDQGPMTAPTAGQVIHQRRSAVALDGKTALSGEAFYRILSRTMPRCDRAVSERPVPWDALPWEAQVHLGLFVHRVAGLTPGLYLLVRDAMREPVLRQACRREFDWVRPSDCPFELPLYRLAEGDAKRVAAQVSCHQEIAADGAFSLGMIAEFESTVREKGPWWYRRLFWETGLIGQVLYLEAEAAGVRGTGIGCFFDDPVHQILGIADRSFQSLYHFTVGGPVDDARLMTLPPYGPEGRKMASPSPEP
ncbi:MAG: SagB/ThcOx family dehydrogenase [Nitrospira sp.]|nr:MAG: SagB/ThcOx family dehydrogenase [Nitrospira sp.]